jgi:hypothetical protein
MKATHQRADEAARFEAEVLRALAEPDDRKVMKIAHADVMALPDAKVAQIGKKAKRKARV